MSELLVHYRKDTWGQCLLGLVVKSDGKAVPTLNLQTVADGPEQMFWREGIKHGCDRGTWHKVSECAEVLAKSPTGAAKK